MHVSMPVAQGSSKVLIYGCAPVAKDDTCVCLCSCTLCEGKHAQVTISPLTLPFLCGASFQPGVPSSRKPRGNTTETAKQADKHGGAQNLKFESSLAADTHGGARGFCSKAAFALANTIKFPPVCTHGIAATLLAEHWKSWACLLTELTVNLTEQ